MHFISKLDSQLFNYLTCVSFGWGKMLLVSASFSFLCCAARLIVALVDLVWLQGLTLFIYLALALSLAIEWQLMYGP